MYVNNLTKYRTGILWILAFLTMSTFSMTAKALPKFTLLKPRLRTLGGTNVQPTTWPGRPRPAVECRLNRWLTWNHTTNLSNYKYPKDASLNHRNLTILTVNLIGLLSKMSSKICLQSGSRSWGDLSETCGTLRSATTTTWRGGVQVWSPDLHDTPQWFDDHGRRESSLRC